MPLTLRSPTRRTRRPLLEVLEDRLVPALYTVNALGDAGSGSGTSGDLRYCISHSNSNPGSTITFDTTLFATHQTITLGGTELPSISVDLTIQGPAAGVTVSGNQQSRVFEMYSPLANIHVALSDLTVTGGKETSDYGGGIDSYCPGGLTLTRCTLAGNFSGAGGGGLHVSFGAATLTDCTVTGNTSAQSGGGILDDSSAPLSLTNCTVGGNSAAWAGGGLNTQGGSVTLTNCAVSGNFGGTGAGGYHNDNATVTLTHCAVSGNSGGGGLENADGALTLFDCTIAGNTTVGNGGGLYMFQGSAVFLNCTVAQNQIVGPDHIWNGAGIWNSFGNLKLTNTIVAGNLRYGSPDQIGNGGTLTGTYNLIGTGDAGGLTDGVNHNQVGVADPKLAPLGDYGGTTQTVALLTGSPALLAGDATVDGLPATDQRGFARVVNGKVDVGAYETQPAAVSFAVTTTADPGEYGKQSLRGAVGVANAVGGNPTITFDTTVFATPQTIVLGGAGPLLVTASQTIQGPATGVTVSGNHQTGVFLIGDGTHNPDVALSTMTITQGTGSTAHGFFGANGGGINDISTGTLTLTGCTVSGNTVALGFGGGIYKERGSLTLVNCTVADNRGTQGGGIRLFQARATLTNDTISGNTAGGTSGGGGLFSLAFAFTVNNTVVDGNFDVNQAFPDDIAGAGASGSNNVIGSGALQNGVNGNQVGVSDPGLAPLGNYGGPTPTMLPLPGSPALGAGSVALAVDQNGHALTTDQRGFARTQNNAVDVGAVETRGFSLTATAGDNQSAVINTAFSQALAAHLQEGTGATAVGLAGVEVDFAGPGSGADLTTTPSATTDLSGNASVSVTANGTTGAYSVSATADGLSAAFHLRNVEVPGLVVTTTSDVVDPFDNQTSLREAIAYANTLPGTPAVTFDSTVFATAKTITLGGTELPVLVHDMTLTGPSAGVTVSGNHASRVFEVGGGSHVAIGNLTITQGRTTANGAGVLVDGGGSLALANCTLQGNSSSDHGAGLFNNGTATLTDCTLAGNSAGFGGGLDSTGTVTLTDCTLANNVASYGGGLNDSYTATLLDCTLTGNTAYVWGGGLLSAAGSAALTDCTLAGNSAANGGGLFNQTGQTALLNCTLAGNSAAAGGGLFSYDTVTLTNSLVAGNTGSDDPDMYTFNTSKLSASYNLIGDCTGSGVTATAGNHNQVGTHANPLLPLLAPLGDYGGPTQTMALLPGSPALDAADTTSAPAADQRGQSRFNAADIGAFESQGFTLAVKSGDNQRTNPNTAFGTALAVNVTANKAAEPVQNGCVSFTAPTVGATGTFAGGISTAVVSIAAEGSATSPTFTANGTLGSYTVSAAAAGSTPTVLFHLANADTIPPTVTAVGLVNITAGGGTSYGFTVTFADNMALDVSSLQTGNARVTGPGGFSAPATFVGVDSTANGTPRTATYCITPPGGFWDNPDNGTYTVCLLANQVKDTSGNAAAAQTLGTFTANITKGFAAVINGNLIVAGTAGNDSLVVTYGGTAFAVQINGTTQTISPASQVTGHVIFYGYDGNDQMTMQGALPAEFHGGAGTDVIHGGDGGNVLCGGTGTLTAYAGAGCDILVGGSGKATLYGGRGHAVLLGGSLKAGMGFDTYAALAALAAQWAAANTSQEASLKAALVAGAADTLYAGTGDTWGFAAAANDFMGFLTTGSPPRDKKSLLN